MELQRVRHDFMTKQQQRKEKTGREAVLYFSL